MRTMKPLLSAFAIAAIGIGISACNPASVTSSPGSSGTSSAGTTSVSTGPGRYVLQAMPAGTVTLTKGTDDTLLARVDVFGLTPGSSHSVYLATEGGHTIPFSTLTADATGRADVTLTSQGRADGVHRGRLVILLGTSSGDSLANEKIAESILLPETGQTAPLRPVSPYGRPTGIAAITFNPGAQTLSVTVTAAGLTPGPHAAHIHLGSCLNQGGVKYMLPDFVADSNGAIVDQTRVATGVTSYPGPGNWYLNLHMGSMNQILSNGTPTLFFRPMLCTNITSVAVTGSASPSASPSASMSMSPSSSPSSTPSSSMSSSPAASSSPSASASTPTQSPSASPTTSAYPTPTAYPTHW